MNTIQTQNLWERFGFRDNPFDTRAFSVSPEAALPVSVAYVRRQSSDIEHRLMTNFLRNPGGCCIFVEGEVGVERDREAEQFCIVTSSGEGGGQVYTFYIFRSLNT